MPLFAPLSELVTDVRWAEPSDVPAVMRIFRLYAETRHKRRDYVERMVASRSVIFDNGVAWILVRPKMRVRWGTAQLQAGDVACHGIACDRPGSGAAFTIARRVFARLDELRLSFWTSMRLSNKRSIGFFAKSGAKYIGDIAWSRGTLPGRVMRREPVQAPAAAAD